MLFEASNTTTCLSIMLVCSGFWFTICSLGVYLKSCLLATYFKNHYVNFKALAIVLRTIAIAIIDPLKIYCNNAINAII